MTQEILLNPDQLQQLIKALKPDTSSFWPSWPIFWGAFAGVCSGIILEQARRWFDRRKGTREQYEKELELVNIVITGFAHNIWLLLTSINQQIIPHFDQSCAARLELKRRSQNPDLLAEFAFDLGKYNQMTTLCPNFPFFRKSMIDELPFLIENNPDLVLEHERLQSYFELFSSAVSDRNNNLNTTLRLATISKLTFLQLDTAISLQAGVSLSECIYSYYLLSGSVKVVRALEEIGTTYEGKVDLKKIKPKKAIELPAVAETLGQLTMRIPAEILRMANPPPTAQA